MPVEGWPVDKIEHKFGWLDQMTAGRLPAGSYTDDGQMALGLLDSLVQAGGFDPLACALAWQTGFDPFRGYGARIRGVMDRLAAGEDWRLAGTDSFGNGAAMRIGPLGVWLHDRPEELTRAALDSARITHHHPEARAGALVTALACARAVEAGLAGERLDPGRVIDHLTVAAGEIDPGLGRALAKLNDVRPGPAAMIRNSWVAYITGASGPRSRSRRPLGRFCSPITSRTPSARRSTAAGTPIQSRPWPEPWPGLITAAGPFRRTGWPGSRVGIGSWSCAAGPREYLVNAVRPPRS